VRHQILRLTFRFVSIVPGVLLALGVANYILNHFFVGAPYLLDSGLLSGIAYRSGALQAIPEISMNATSFYQVYFSPIISIFSGISYLLPVERIEWFAIVQGLVFFPFGIAVPLLAARLYPATQWRRLPAVFVAGFAYSFCGLVLWMVGYPHYEAATPGLICLTLVSLVTGRTRLTWLFLGLAASIRQDSGIHAAVAIAPLIYLKWRGTELRPTLRRLLVTFGVAVGASVAGIIVQKLFFDTFDRLRDVYLGTPIYGHVTVALIAERARNFLVTCQVIYYPFLGTVLLSALRRDPRYLLGWAATLPWFVFSFIAYDNQKAAFTAYAVMPFAVGLFWVYLYGALLAPVNRRLPAGVLELLFALICVSSTLGMHRGAPVPLKYTVKEMAILHRRDRAAVHAFVDRLRTHRADFGGLSVDYAVSAMALENLKLDDAWTRSRNVGPDTFVFHDRAPGEDQDVLFPEIIISSLDWCTRIVRTHIVACSREPFPATTFAGIDTEVAPAAFAFTRIARTGVRVEREGVTVQPGASFSGPFGRLPAGTYRLTVAFATNTPGAARLFVETPREALDDVSMPAGARDITVRFTTDGGELPLAYRFTSLSDVPLTIIGAQLRRIDAPAPAPAAR